MAIKKKATQKKAVTKKTKAKSSVKEIIPDENNSYISPSFWKAMWIICGISIILEFFINRHKHFKELDASVLGNMSNWFGFYGMLGLIACSGSILIAKGLSVFLKAKEDFHDDTP